MKRGHYTILVTITTLLLIVNITAFNPMLNNDNVIAENQANDVDSAILDSYTLWTTTEVVSTESSQRSLRPSIAVDSKDNVHIVWHDLTNYNGAGSDEDIFYKCWNATTRSWTTTIIVSTESNGNSVAPSIAIDENDNIHIVWRDPTNYLGSGSDWDIFYKQRFSNGTWKAAEVVSTESTFNVIWLHIAVKNDEAYVVYQDNTNYLGSGSDNDIMYKKRFINGTWTVAEVVSTESNLLSRFPFIVIDNDLNPHISWQDSTNYLGSGSDEDIFYKWKDSSTGIWSSAEIISTESWAESQRVSMVIDDTGNKHLVYFDSSNYNGAGSDRDIFYKSWNTSSSTWNAAEVISTESSSSSEVPYLISDKLGNLHCFWFDTTNINGAGIDQDIVHKIWNSTLESWGSVRVISTDSTGNSWRPVAAIDSMYVIHVVWLDITPNYKGSGIDIDIFYSKGIEPDLLEEISIVSAPEDFSYLINTTGNQLSWLLTDDNVTNPRYVIYENGTEVTNQSWSSNVPIILNVDGLSLGGYNFTLEADDGWGHIVKDTVIVSVVEELEDPEKFTFEKIKDVFYGLITVVGVVGLTMLIMWRRK